MKFLKLFLYFIAILVLVIFIYGFLHPKFTTKNEILINASPEQVWTMLSDDTKMAQWMPGFISLKTLEGKKMEVGSKHQLDFNQDGEDITIFETVTMVEPNKHFAFDVDTDVFSGHNDIRLIAEGSGTKLSTENLIDGKNVFYDAMFYFMKNYFQEQDLNSYQRMKAVLESD